jgi:outer membrane lipoprotein-sorting protein
LHALVCPEFEEAYHIRWQNANDSGGQKALSLQQKWCKMERVTICCSGMSNVSAYPDGTGSTGGGNKMKTFRASLTVVAILALSALAFGQPDAKTTQMMEELARKAANINSYRVDTKMETQMMGQKMTMDGAMAVKKPNKMHVTTTSSMMQGMKTETYTSGDTVWTYMPAMKMAHKIDMAKVKAQFPEGSEMAKESDITKPFEGFPKDSIKYIEKKTVDGTEVHVFEALTENMPQMPQGQGDPQMIPHKMVFWLNAGNGLPQKVLFLNKDGSTMMTQTYSNFRINVPIPDSEFEFSPPEGVQVMDMTEGTLNMMKQMQQAQPKAEK